MNSSNEFISVSNKAFPNLVSFEVWILGCSDGSFKYVICFDKLDYFTALVQLWFYLKNKKLNVFVYLSNEFYQKNDEYLKLILKHRLQYINCWGGVYTDNNQRINLMEEMFSDLMVENSNSYTKYTQLVFKYYLFNKIKPYTVRSIAEYINISPASVSRANETLYQLGVLQKEGVGAGIEYTLINKKKAIKLLNNYYLLPYENMYSLLLDDYEYGEMQKNPLSGDYAISEYSELLPLTSVKTYAVWKKKFAPFYNAYQSLSHNFSNNFATVHTFIYDPTLFAINGVIDLLDIYIVMLKKYDLNDPRINQAFKVIERKLIDE